MKKANITIYREIMEQIKAYEAGILEDAPKQMLSIRSQKQIRM